MKLKDRFAHHDKTIGSWITLGNSSIAEIFSKAGLDWVVVDLEHSVIDISQAADLIRTIDLSGTAPLVRLTSNNSDQIKRVMDAGAHGIIVPMVNNENDAVKAVEYSKYPPYGKRGVGLSRAQNYGVSFNEYKQWAKENLVIIAQIEHIEGVKNLDKIISIKGIDGIIVGPYDLSGSLGFPGEFDREDVKKALTKVKEICLEKKFPMGYHVVEPDVELVNSKILEGYTFMAFSTDFYFMGQKAKDSVIKIKS